MFSATFLGASETLNLFYSFLRYQLRFFRSKKNPRKFSGDLPLGKCSECAERKNRSCIATYLPVIREKSTQSLFWVVSVEGTHLIGNCVKFPRILQNPLQLDCSGHGESEFS